MDIVRSFVSAVAIDPTTTATVSLVIAIATALVIAALTFAAATSLATAAASSPLAGATARGPVVSLRWKFVVGWLTVR